MILDIKHFSQIWQDNEWLADWENRICWLACIKMCIEYFNWNSPSYDELMQYKDSSLTWLSFRDGKEKTYTYYIPWNWWFQYWLVLIAKKYWLFWVTDFINPIYSEERFIKYLNKNQVIITSCTLNFEEKEKRWWHLVVLKWIEKNWDETNYIINDPIEKNWNLVISKEKFNKSFSWNFIIISKINEEVFLVNNPIYIETFWNPKSQNVFVHIHENERLSYTATKEFLKDKKHLFVALHQNKERFIRYAINNEDWNKIFLRVDPNRIFTEDWLKTTIVERNLHLNKSLLEEAVEKWTYIKDYITSKLPKKINYCIWVHNNKLIDINDYKKEAIKIYINPKDSIHSFILAYREDDYEKIKKFDISCAFIDYWNKKLWSLADYFYDDKIRYLTVETSYDDKQNYDKYLNVIWKIIK